MNYQRPPTDTIRLSISKKPLCAQLGDTLLAESHAVIVLQEPGYPDRYYFPRLDVRMERLHPSDKTTFCPHKGTAEYFHVETEDEQRDNFAWSYPAAKLHIAEISGYIAFYDDDPAISIR